MSFPRTSHESTSRSDQGLRGTTDEHGDEPVYDLVGVGFGPSNLALAIAVTEESPPTRMTFLEAQETFGWHSGMLLDGATMQVSFLKDLATMRRPTSDFSYVSFLAQRGRLAEFINGRTLYPLRREFHEYLEWAASRLDEHVEFGLEVVGISPVLAGPHIECLDVVARHRSTNEVVTRRARNVVIAPGLEPRLPKGIIESSRVWHSNNLRYRLETWDRDRPWNFAVVGAGQSAAEAVYHLHNQFRHAKVDAVFARYGYSVADDSPFVNAIFNPGAVDEVYEAPDAVRQSLFDYHQNTNYGVVDLDLSRQLHSILYEEMVSGAARLRIRRSTVVRSATETPDGVDLELKLPGRGTIGTTVEYDAVVFATGYEPIPPLRFLSEISEHFLLDDRGRLQFMRDYRVATTSKMRGNIFVHGPAVERSHGLTAGLLSTIAVRAGEIAWAIQSGGGVHATGPSENQRA